MWFESFSVTNEEYRQVLFCFAFCCLKEEVKLFEVCWLLEFKYAVLNRKQEGVTVESTVWSADLSAFDKINCFRSSSTRHDTAASNQVEVWNLVLWFVHWMRSTRSPRFKIKIVNFAGVTGKCCVCLGMLMKRHLWFSTVRLVVISTATSSDFHWAFSNAFHKKIVLLTSSMMTDWKFSLQTCQMDSNMAVGVHIA